MLTKTSMIEQFLLHEITSGKIHTGSRIPSRSQLCKRFNCSRTIVERAITALSQHGYLTGQQGSGTYVISTAPSGRQINKLRILYDFSIDNAVSSILPSPNLDDMNINVKILPMNQLQTDFDKLSMPGTAIIALRPGVNKIILLEKLQKRNIPILLLNRNYEGFDYIMTDPQSSIKEGLSWLLIESGRNIGFVSRRPGTIRPYLAERILSFYEAATELGANLTPEWCISRNFFDYTEDTAEVGRRLFGSPKHPDGIFILDVDLVLPIISYGQSYGLTPGKDYKLLTFDEVPELAGRPNIAMMKQPNLLYEKEIRRWLSALHTNTPFQSALKTELQVFRD